MKTTEIRRPRQPQALWSQAGAESDTGSARGEIQKKGMEEATS